MKKHSSTISQGPRKNFGAPGKDSPVGQNLKSRSHNAPAKRKLVGASYDFPRESFEPPVSVEGLRTDTERDPEARKNLWL